MNAGSPRRLAAVLSVAVLLATSAAHAQDADRVLAEARGELEGGRPDAARRAIDALVQGGALMPSQVAEAYEIQGLAYVAQGDEASAEGAFTTMFSIDTTREVRGRHAIEASDALVSAQTARGDAGPLRIDAGMRERWRRGAAPVISAGVYGDVAGIVARLDVYYRPAGEAGFLVKTQEGAGPHEISLVLLAGRPPQPIEYYSEAFDDFGNQLVARGTDSDPERIDPALVPDRQGGGGQVHAPPPSTLPSRAADPTVSRVGGDGPWQMADHPRTDDPEGEGGGVTSKWWFWGGLGAVVVGGIVAVVVLGSGGDAGASSGVGCFGGDCDVTVGPPP